MNILVWNDGFWPEIGGVETQTLQFVHAMQARGHFCTVLAQKKRGNEKEEETFEGILIRRFDFDAIIKKKELKIIRSVAAYLKTIRADIVYLNTLGNGSAFAFTLLRKELPIPVVATVHSPYFFDGSIAPSILQVCSQIDQICCASKWGQSVMEKLLPPQKRGLKMIYYGLSPPLIDPTPLPLSSPTVLLLGRLSSEKGFEMGIEAFSLLRKKGIEARLLIGGEGAERPFLEHLVDRFSLRPYTHFTGSLSREQVYPVINQATFTVMPSHYEAFGLVALESMQLGRPVIASDVGGLPEIVAHGERGLLVPTGRPEAFSSAMEALLTAPEKTQAMGAAARQWALKTYLLQENVDQYEQLFKRLGESR